MGKRSNFERVERDFYPTPLAAVHPLVRHLPASFSYWEPCAGAFDLCKHINSLCDISFYTASDIEPADDRVRRSDAFQERITPVDYIITNPPWDRKILHPMIEHFSAVRPTWLLFDADWCHTKQSAPFMPYLHKIVAVGRVKWIPDSKFTGKDNCAWHLFDQRKPAQTRFFGHEAT